MCLERVWCGRAIQSVTNYTKVTQILANFFLEVLRLCEYARNKTKQLAFIYFHVIQYLFIFYLSLTGWC